MRRLLGLFLVVAMIPALAVTAKDTGEYRDDFGSGGYSGNDGNLPWTGNWVESGESDGPDDGAVQISDQNCSNDKCLHIEGQGLIQLNRSISRGADLSRFLDARLTYDVDIKTAVSLGTFYVQVTGDGSGWHTVKSYALLTTGGSHTESFDVSPWRGPDFEVRFRLAGVLGGDDVAVDRVSVSGQLESVTSSTTSTTSTTSTSSTTSTTTPPAITIPAIPGIGPSTITIPTIPGIGPSTPTSTTSTTIGTVQTTRPNEGQGPIDSGGIDQSAAPARSTTTTTTGTTTTTVAGAGALRTPPGSSGGLRETGGGLLVDYRSGMMGDMGTGEIEVLGAELTANFSMAVEVFQVAKIWIAILALGIAAAAISGVERRRARPEVMS